MSGPIPSLAEASAGIAAGTLSPVALTEAALARIAALDPKLNAFITRTADRARRAAARRVRYTCTPCAVRAAQRAQSRRIVRVKNRFEQIGVVGRGLESALTPPTKAGLYSIL